jgi:hypothetical protein
MALGVPIIPGMELAESLPGVRLRHTTHYY